ncbi:MAG: SoxR reducing system RseC family protein [Dysgonamonadaceae bacterium]|jgi:sigma-E factor negative regulatory protein RseC|nr:SoxR reducing system RseC family protein [Dysgonamonadaceae bacterium]
MKGFIEQQGTVLKTAGNLISVKIACEAACGGCSAKDSCSVVEKKDKIIVIEKHSKQQFNIGDTVTVAIRRDSALKAVLLAFVAPFSIILSALIILNFTDITETAAGLISVGILLPYFSLLWLLRKKLNNSFKIVINECQKL